MNGSASAYAIITTVDSNMVDSNGHSICKDIKTGFEDLESAVRSYNMSLNMGGFIRIKLLKCDPFSKHVSIIAINDAASTDSYLDSRVISSTFSGRSTSPLRLEGF